jgi:Ca2+-binding RTX toxin-like protein
VELVGVDVVDFDRETVSLVRFLGGDGPDDFENSTDVCSEAFGHKGGDTLTGGSAADTFYGGPGEDSLYGNGGADDLDGGNNPDLLLGGEGDDVLFGGLHGDELNGEGGNDSLLGDRGDDLLYGGTGDDYILGFTENDLIWSGTGNDQSWGQQGIDTLYGEAGEDVLGGGPADDMVYGGGDADTITGDQENDTLYGDGGDDVILAWLGNDFLYGGDGNDHLYSQEGDDSVFGGTGVDVVLGGPGSDAIYGDGGNDVLYGQIGNDMVRGGDGVDWLLGGADADSLFAGAAAWQADQLEGGTGYDRFLVFSTDTVNDFSAGDATLVFVNVDSNWTDAEMETADQAFGRLFQGTGNTILLRETLNTKPLTFYKEANLGGAAGINSLSWTSTTTCGPTGCTTTYDYTRRIRIVEWDETNPWTNDAFIDVFVHEIGHNWDSEEELTSVLPGLAGQWGNFMAVADWQSTWPGAGYTQSLDGQWWYRSNAWFYEDYARTNPREDMATTWEYFFDQYQDGSLDHSAMMPRLAVLDNIFAMIDG